MDENKKNVFWEVANLLKMVYATLISCREGNNRAFLWAMLSIFLLFSVTEAAQITIIPLYLLNFPLNWTATDMSYYVCFLGVLSCISTLIAPILFKRFNIPETIIVLISLISLFGFLVTLALAKNTLMVYGASIVGLLNKVGWPAAKSFLVQLVGDDEVGQVFAITGLCTQCSILFGGAVFNVVYLATLDIFSHLNVAQAPRLHRLLPKLHTLLPVHFRRVCIFELVSECTGKICTPFIAHPCTGKNS